MNIESSVCDTTTANISTLMEKFVLFWNEKKTDCLLDLFDEGSEFTNIANQVAKGKEAIFQQQQKAFDTVMKKAEIRLTGIYARALSEELVIVTCRWETFHNLDMEGKETPNRNGVMQVIAKKIEEGYKITLVHNTALSPLYGYADANTMVNA